MYISILYDKTYSNKFKQKYYVRFFFILKIEKEDFLRSLDKEFIIQTDPSYLSPLWMICVSILFLSLFHVGGGSKNHYFAVMVTVIQFSKFFLEISSRRTKKKNKEKSANDFFIAFLLFFLGPKLTKFNKKSVF